MYNLADASCRKISRDTFQYSDFLRCSLEVYSWTSFYLCLSFKVRGSLGGAFFRTLRMSGMLLKELISDSLIWGFAHCSISIPFSAHCSHLFFALLPPPPPSLPSFSPFCFSALQEPKDPTHTYMFSNLNQRQLW